MALARSLYWRETIKMGGIVDRPNFYPGSRDVDLIDAVRGLRRSIDSPARISPEWMVHEKDPRAVRRLAMNLHSMTMQFERRFRIKILIIGGIAAVALFAAVNGVWRSHSPSTIGYAGKRSGSTVQEMQSNRSVDKLPVEDFEDLSLVFPREAKR